MGRITRTMKAKLVELHIQPGIKSALNSHLPQKMSTLVVMVTRRAVYGASHECFTFESSDSTHRWTLVYHRRRASTQSLSV